MPSLKSLRVRIKSVKATQKITSAMKMVAAAKLRRSQDRVESARPYAREISKMLGNCLSDMSGIETKPLLYMGNPDNKTHLIVVCTSDRGLCGGFNSSIVREVRQQIKVHQAEGRSVQLYFLGKKGREQLLKDHANLMIGVRTDFGRSGPTFEEAEDIASYLETMTHENKVGSISIIYSTFKSVLTQVVTVHQLIPFPSSEALATLEEGGKVLYDFEPTQTDLLQSLLPRNLAVQIYQALLETTASEHGARMTAMDNATRNARDVIKKLELNYNRTRQAYITKELIEIISGAEVL
jgi:F-type H+-transporting ATPase subunit gamma